MALGQADDLAGRFADARRLVNGWRICPRAVGKTYQGWIKALTRFSPRLLRALGNHLRGEVQRVAGDYWRLGRWVVFGADGSKASLRRMADLMASFGTAGKKASGPQALLTTILHLTTGLPWDARIGRACASERTHLLRMLRRLPADALLVGDAGFVGYPVWNRMQQMGLHFLVRAGSNVNLLRGLGYGLAQHGDLVYLWPDRERRAGREPLVLRLIRLHDGRREMCLLTNVLDEKELSLVQAKECYRLRWGIELWYRQVKQTAARSKLNSAAPTQATLELAWLVVAMTLLGLMGVDQAMRQGRDPLALSPAKTLGALRTLAKQPQLRGGLGTLGRQLGQAFKDDYQRKGPKRPQPWPAKKKQRPPGVPKITDADATQIAAAAALWCKLHGP